MTEKLNNVIVPFILHKFPFKGKIVKLSDTINEAISKHFYPHHISEILCKMLISASMIGNNFKQGILTVQLKSDGIVSLIIADYFDNGKIRGYAKWDNEKYQEIKDTSPSFRSLVGNGVIAITIDQGPGTDLYQGIVEITGEDLDQTLEAYFTQSEQTETAFKIAAEKHNDSWAASGIMIQKLPDSDKAFEFSDDWNRVKLFMDTIKDTELLDNDIEPGLLLYRLFHEDDLWIYDAKPIIHGCRCSRERASNILKSLSDEELEDLITANNKLDVTCQFCSKTEIFNNSDFH